MPVHARLYRRGAAYYHRAAIPLDIKNTYPKSEETFSLKTKNYDEALKLLRIAAVEVDERFEAHRRMLRGEKQPEQKRLVQPSVVLEVETDSLLPLLSQVRDDWFAMKEREGAWIPRTKDQYRIWTDRFLAIIGDRRITQYSKADGRRFKDIIFKLPANIDKRKELKGLPLVEVGEVAEALGMEPMSITNANKAIAAVSALWRWIGNNYDEEPSNPLQGMLLKSKTTSRKEREPFAVDELNAIFRAPTFTGCQSYSKWRVPGSHSMKNSYRYWVPLIAVFSGMRMNESCQLYTEDVQEEGGILFFNIHENREDMKLKNAHSKRIIPVHQELIKLGFTDLVKQRKEHGEARLFPDLEAGKDGYYSTNASKHFQRFFKAVGVKHGKNCFHSFRHSFEDACRDSGVAKDVMDALQGHKERGMSARYGSGFGLLTLNEAMQKVRYRGLDLSPLAVW